METDGTETLRLEVSLFNSFATHKSPCVSDLSSGLTCWSISRLLGKYSHRNQCRQCTLQHFHVSFSVVIFTTRGENDLNPEQRRLKTANSKAMVAIN